MRGYDASPLSISKGAGRLILPPALLAPFENCEGLAADLEAFRAYWYETYMVGDACLGTVEKALRSNTAATGDAPGASTNALPAPKAEGDPTTQDQLDGIDCAAVVPTGNGLGKVHLTKAGQIYVSAQSEHGVLANERVILFGSGGFRPAAEAEEAREKGRVAIFPELTADSQVIYKGGEGDAEEVAFLGNLLTRLLGKGHIREPIVIPFHAVQHTPATQTACAKRARLVMRRVRGGEGGRVSRRGERQGP